MALPDSTMEMYHVTFAKISHFGERNANGNLSANSLPSDYKFPVSLCLLKGKYNAGMGTYSLRKGVGRARI